MILWPRIRCIRRSTTSAGRSCCLASLSLDIVLLWFALKVKGFRRRVNVAQGVFEGGRFSYGVIDTVLAVSQVCKSYPTPRGPLEVLSGVSFSLSRGDAVAIMGPSGSGKSTLLYILGALDPPPSGT